MELTPRLLEQFVAVVDEGHVGRAAARLHISQPPLSQAIGRLESGLGVRLLDRGPRGVTPTAAGQAFVADARSLLAAQAAAVGRARRVAAGLEGTVRLGFVTGTTGRVTALVRACARELPGLGIELEQAPSGRLAEAVAQGSLDTALLREPIAAHAGLVVVPVGEDRLGVALPADDPRAGEAGLDLGRLVDDRVVLLTGDAGAEHGEQVLRATRVFGFEPRVAARADSVAGLLAHVAAGSGVALVPLDPASHRPGVAVVPLESIAPGLRTGVVAVHRPDPDAAVARVIALAGSGG